MEAVKSKLILFPVYDEQDMRMFCSVLEKMYLPNLIRPLKERDYDPEKFKAYIAQEAEDWEDNFEGNRYEKIFRLMYVTALIDLPLEINIEKEYQPIVAWRFKIAK